MTRAGRASRDANSEVAREDPLLIPTRLAQTRWACHIDLLHRLRSARRLTSEAHVPSHLDPEPGRPVSSLAREKAVREGCDPRGDRCVSSPSET